MATPAVQRWPVRARHQHIRAHPRRAAAGARRRRRHSPAPHQGAAVRAPGDAPKAQGVAKIGNPTQFCIWTADGGTEPYQTSSVGYTWTKEDEEVLRALKASAVRDDAPQRLREAHQGDYTRTLQASTRGSRQTWPKGPYTSTASSRSCTRSACPHRRHRSRTRTQTQTQTHEGAADGAYAQQQGQHQQQGGQQGQEGRAPQGATDAGQMMLVQYLWDGTAARPALRTAAARSPRWRAA